MDPIFLVTGLLTVAAAIAGLILTCHLERRALAARRGRISKRAPTQNVDNRPVVN